MKVGTRSKYAPELVVILWGICLASALFVMDHRAPAGRRVLKVTGRDSVHYFANAHSLLFDRDFDLRNEFEELKPSPTVLDIPGRPGVQGLPGSPWAIGYSLLSTPFVALGTLVDAVAGRPANGYGMGAIAGYFLANIVFVALGLVCQLKVLRHFGASALDAVLVTLATWFSTTLVYYTFSPMSHAVTFALASVFLLVWSHVHETASVRGWFVLGLVGGLLSICRWQDGAFVLAPVLFAIGRGLAPWRRWLAFGGGVAVGWIPQIAQWRAVYGEYVTMPYLSGVGEFPPRHVLDVLFSTDHGWFIWTPLTLLAMAGLFLNVRRFWPWMVVIALELAFVGSLRQFWNCGDSFGIRMLTSCTPLIALGIATLLSATRGAGRSLLLAAIAGCCVYTTLFALQYRLDMVPRQGPLTASELLWDKIFLKEAYRRTHTDPQGGFR